MLICLLQYQKELHKETCKLFADLAVVRKELETRQMNEKKRQREQEMKQQEELKMKKEWDKNYEVHFSSCKTRKKIGFVGKSRRTR